MDERQRRDFYKSYKWKQVRQQVLFRDGGRCRLGASAKCRGAANQVHHIVDVQDDPRLAYDMGNLVSACSACNIAERNRRVAARARAKRDGREVVEGERWFPGPSRDWSADPAPAGPDSAGPESGLVVYSLDSEGDIFDDTRGWRDVETGDPV